MLIIHDQILKGRIENILKSTFEYNKAKGLFNEDDERRSTKDTENSTTESSELEL